MNKKAKEERNEILYVLNRRFKEAIRFFKKTKLNKDKKTLPLSSLPWFLIIGPSHSGKSSILLNSELNFILKKKSLHNETTPPSSNFSWWATKDAILVDTPGVDFLKSDSEQSVWNYFLKLLRKNIPRNQFHGIILVLGIDQLISQTEQQKEQFYHNVRSRLSCIAKQLSKEIPLFILFNKHDLITGFCEFFDDLSKEERQQYWGTRLNSNYNEKEVSEKMDRLLSRLDDQVIWKLHHENNTIKKALINDFPLQTKKLKQHILRTINRLFVSPPKYFLQPNGIFFTSSDQKITTNQSEKRDITLSSQYSLQASSLGPRAFFVHDLFKYLISRTTPFRKPSIPKLKDFWISFISYSLISASLAGLLYIGFINFKHTTSSIILTQRAILSYQILSKQSQKETKLPADQSNFTSSQAETKKTLEKSDEKRLHTLNTLQEALQPLNQKQTFPLFNLTTKHFYNLNTLKEKSSGIYTTTLKTFLEPKIKDSLVQILSDPSTSPELSYESLKTYLIISNQITFNPNQIINTMKKIWGDQYSEKTSKQLLNHLSEMLKAEKIFFKLNQKIIENARKKLRELPLDQLSYIILINSTPNNQPLSLNLGTNKNAALVFTFANVTTTISSFYTKENFKKIYPVLLRQAAKETLLGNVIIGKTDTHQTVIEEDIDKLTKELFQQYLDHYAQTWLRFLNNIKIVNFINIHSLKEGLEILSDSNSPLLQLTHLVQNELIEPVLEINSELRTLFEFLNQKDKQNSSISNILLALSDLKNKLSSTIKSEDLDVRAFQLAKFRMQNKEHVDEIGRLLALSKQTPEPIRNWIYTIASNAWQLMLFHAQNHINHHWQTTILPQYQAQISDHFPFSKKASKQASLESFSTFFSENGLLNQFFRSYLQPFVDTSQTPWETKHLDGQGLVLSHSLLSFFKKANNLRRIYFYSNTNQLYIPFTLHAEKIEKEIKEITISIGSQKFVYHNQSPLQSFQFVWPDDNNSNSTSIIFAHSEENKNILDEPGPWGWLKLLEKSKMKLIKETKRFAVTFQEDKDKAQFSLEIKQHKNPFSLENLYDLSFPREI